MLLECLLAVGLLIPPCGHAPYEPPPVWAALADCESGFRDRGGAPIPGSARWDYNGSSGFDGGLQFHPDTWTDFTDDPRYAHEATPREQVAVAEHVLKAQGWGAWPVCSRMLGYR